MVAYCRSISGAGETGQTSLSRDEHQAQLSSAYYNPRRLNSVRLGLYFAPKRAAKYCHEYMFVGVSVCLSARVIRKPHDRTSPNFWSVACGDNSFLLWRRCDTLSTSGFVNDVIFSYKGPPLGQNKYCIIFKKKSPGGGTLLTSDNNSVWLIFTTRRLAKRGICRRRVSVCLSVCLSVCVCVCVCHTPVLYQNG